MNGGKVKRYTPSTLPDQIQKMQIQPPQAHAPLPRMAVGGFEVDAAGFEGGGNVPAAAALVGDDGEGGVLGEGGAGDEVGVVGDGVQARGEGLVAAVERGGQGVDVGGGEDEVRGKEYGEGHSWGGKVLVWD